jgi:hypothetical protein
MMRENTAGMNPILQRWADNEWKPDELHDDPTGKWVDYKKLMKAIPSMSHDELRFILQQPIFDRLRDLAKDEIMTRGFFQSPFERNVVLACIILSGVAGFVELVRVAATLLPCP